MDDRLHAGTQCYLLMYSTNALINMMSYFLLTGNTHNNNSILLIPLKGKDRGSQPTRMCSVAAFGEKPLKI